VPPPRPGFLRRGGAGVPPTVRAGWGGHPTDREAQQSGAMPGPHRPTPQRPTPAGPVTIFRRAVTTFRRAIDEQEPDDDLRADVLGPCPPGARPELVGHRRLRARAAARPDQPPRAASPRGPQLAPARARHPALVLRGRRERRTAGDPHPDA